MNILVVASTSFEIAPFIEQNPKASVLITGIGMPASLYQIQKTIGINNYDIIIQAGIAGAFTNEFELGETVLVKQDTFGDIGIEEKQQFTPIFETDLLNKNEFPFKNGWLFNDNKILQQSNLELVKAITVNKVNDNLLLKEQLMELFNPEIETMEGAALHYVCLQEKTPFVQIRSISNYVGERDKTKWKMELAIKNLNTELEKLISEL
ncbi:MAG: futalosine hydrolase [Ferruginibacter sp.]|nr:futalosine hydrolase [Ferruginibacter sp.]